eukprot:TRINITY_DN84895_c0_g1_i1.p1 TRINITY_DN84895_c0_g1~~TRINITY_DN84895_c0_g1_i1.p1  ORF type:complete len:212 (+),score=44.94 TRINITY_DN84895_c0_g1_i1:73-708(+)
MADDIQPKQQLFKYIIIGDVSVGKSCLLNRFMCNPNAMQHNPTIGYEFASKVVNVNGRSVKLHIWDTAGQESFQAITRSYYRGAVGALLVYDVSRWSTFNDLPRWLAEARNNASPNVIIAVLANKNDLEHREVSREEGAAFAQQEGLLYLETSAKTAQNVERAFISVAQAISDAVDEGLIELRDHQGFQAQKQKGTGCGDDYSISCCNVGS